MNVEYRRRLPLQPSPSCRAARGAPSTPARRRPPHTEHCPLASLPLSARGLVALLGATPPPRSEEVPQRRRSDVDSAYQPVDMKAAIRPPSFGLIQFMDSPIQGPALHVPRHTAPPPLTSAYTLRNMHYLPPQHVIYAFGMIKVALLLPSTCLSHSLIHFPSLHSSIDRASPLEPRAHIAATPRPSLPTRTRTPRLRCCTRYRAASLARSLVSVTKHGSILRVYSISPRASDILTRAEHLVVASSSSYRAQYHTPPHLRSLFYLRLLQEFTASMLIALSGDRRSPVHSASLQQRCAP